jgi:hypothetical protein
MGAHVTAVARCAATDAHLPQMCALLVFVTMSNQRAGLWGPSLEACAACNGTQQCTSGVGGPHGLGCPYTAFGQFQCVRSGARGVPENSTSTLEPRLHVLTSGFSVRWVSCGGQARPSCWGWPIWGAARR